jgi:hypothetical protein
MEGLVKEELRVSDLSCLSLSPSLNGFQENHLRIRERIDLEWGL